MSANRSQLKQAVHSMLNDVVEQCFHHLIHHPHQTSKINAIIRDATDEINYQLVRIDAHEFQEESTELREHYQCISKDVHKKSIRLLSELQNVQRHTSI